MNHQPKAKPLPWPWLAAVLLAVAVITWVTLSFLL
jgi:hypothetical protein